jgi:hypothetical protein
MGVILFECATGRKPFLADSLFELLRKHIDEPPPSPRAMRPDLPIEIEQVIHTALAKQPDRRFATAQAMSMALQHATQQLTADQWAPITGSGTHPRPLSSGQIWQGTPPASWASRAPQPQHQVQHQSTVSASSGQVAVAKPKSSKGLWIGLFAIVLVGGGITAAVVATRGSSEPAADRSAEDSTAKTADPPAKQPKADNADKADKAKADKTDDDDKPDKAEADDDDKSTDPDVDKAIEAQMKEALKAVPASERKMIEAQMRDAMKQLPPAQKKAVLDQIKDLSKLGGVGAQVNQALGGTPANGDLVERHTVQPPAWDPKKTDVAAYVTWAIAEGKREVADSQLIRVDVDGVYPDGHADLTLPSLASPHGSIDVRMFSPSHAHRDPKIPRGAQQELKCMFRIIGEPDEVEVRDLSSDCKEIAIHPPRCSAAQVWKKALAKRADLAAHTVAEMGYRADFNGGIHWYFDIRDENISWIFPDDC